MSFTRDEHVVFDANSAPTGQVNAWLDRHHHPGFRTSFDVLGDAGTFVNLQPNPVSQPVTEILAKTGLTNNVPSDRVDRSRGYARADRLDRAALGLQHNSI